MRRSLFDVEFRRSGFVVVRVRSFVPGAEGDRGYERGLGDRVSGV
ncbi:hypothetical protein [Pseudanabaena sp. UWO311]|nr:hypothetical protein [Pseudanabaena sp. UWO311]